MQEQLNKAPEIRDGESVPYIRFGASSPRHESSSFSSSPKASSSFSSSSFRNLRSDSWRGEDVDVLSILQELEDLRSTVTTLRSELAVYEKTEKKEHYVHANQRSRAIDRTLSHSLRPFHIRYIMSFLCFLLLDA
jgi:hypothetical protein